LAVAGHELQGNLEKAIEEYQSFYNNVLLAFYSMPEHFYYFRECSLVNYNIAKIYEQMGDTEKAQEYYQKFLDLWKGTDPGIAEVEDAKKRFAELRK
jgi:tetratricopeptide (TPR) repeat protein